MPRELSGEARAGPVTLSDAMATTPYLRVQFAGSMTKHFPPETSISGPLVSSRQL